MANKWYEISGKSREKVKAALEVFQRNFEVRPSLEGKSFYALTSEENISFLQNLAKEFNLEIEEMIESSVLEVAEEDQRKEPVVKAQPVVTSKKSIKKEMPPKEQLLDLAREHTLRKMAEILEVAESTVHRWLRNIPEANDLRRLSRKEKPVETARAEVKPKTPAEEPLILSIKEKIESFDKEIARLESERAKVVEEWDQKIEKVRKAKEEFTKKILATISEKKK